MTCIKEIKRTIEKTAKYRVSYGAKLEMAGNAIEP